MNKKIISLFIVMALITACETGKRNVVTEDSKTNITTLPVTIDDDGSSLSVACGAEITRTIIASNCAGDVCKWTVDGEPDSIDVEKLGGYITLSGKFEDDDCGKTVDIDVEACDSKAASDCDSITVSYEVGASSNGGKSGGGQSATITGKVVTLKCGSSIAATKPEKAADAICSSGVCLPLSSIADLPDGFEFKYDIASKELLIWGGFDDFEECFNWGDSKDISVTFCDSISSACSDGKFTLKRTIPKITLTPASTDCVFRKGAPNKCDLPEISGGSGDYKVELATDSVLPHGLNLTQKNKRASGSSWMISGTVASIEEDKTVTYIATDNVSGETKSGTVTIKTTDKVMITSGYKLAPNIKIINAEKIVLTASGGSTACAADGDWSWNLDDGENDVDGAQGADTKKNEYTITPKTLNKSITIIKVTATCDRELASYELENVTFSPLTTIEINKVTYNDVEDETRKTALTDPTNPAATIDYNKDIIIDFDVANLKADGTITVEPSSACTGKLADDRQTYSLTCNFDYNAYKDEVITIKADEVVLKKLTFKFDGGVVVQKIIVTTITGQHYHSGTDAGVSIKFCPTNDFGDNCTDSFELNEQDKNDREKGNKNVYTIKGSFKKNNLKYFELSVGSHGDYGDWLLQGIEVKFNEEKPYYVNPCALRWIPENSSAKFGPNDAAVCTVVATSESKKSGTDDQVYLSFEIGANSVTPDSQPQIGPFFETFGNQLRMVLHWDIIRVAMDDDPWYDVVSGVNIKVGDSYNDFEKNDNTSYGAFIFDGGDILNDKTVSFQKNGSDGWKLESYKLYIFNPTAPDNCISATESPSKWLDTEDDTSNSFEITNLSSNGLDSCKSVSNIKYGIGGHL